MTYIYRKVLRGTALLTAFFCTSATSAAVFSPETEQSSKIKPIDLGSGTAVVSQKNVGDDDFGECCPGGVCKLLP